MHRLQTVYYIDMKYSVVVPAHNEAENIRPLYEAVKEVMDRVKSPDGDHAASWELILIDDGSTDETGKIISQLCQEDASVKLIQFRKKFGQTAGWSAGFDYASGEIVIVLDADLQNDPQDIPKLLEKLEKGYDVVSGWRADRHDDHLLMLGSKIGNWLRRKVTGEKIHDHGCSLKVYRREVLQDLELYGEMHRYITALLSWKGYKVGEASVRHHPRKAGRTKYSIKKKLKGFLDLLVVKFWIQYSARPMHFFGAIGAVFILAGLILGGLLGSLWLLRIIALSGRSSPLLAVLLVLLGFQFLLTGVLADVVAHTYYAEKKPYSIKTTKGFKRDTNTRMARE